MKAMPLLLNGVGWRVGNGEKVRIWGNAWLPPPQVWLTRPPRSILPHNARVSTLIDPLSGWWNLDLVRSLFDQGDVDIA
jgi:hypothetical protein